MMLLYLSHVQDEEQLEDIRQECTGPGARPWLLKLTIAVLFAAAGILSMYQARVGVRLFAGRPVTYEEPQEDVESEEEAPKAPASEN